MPQAIRGISPKTTDFPVIILFPRIEPDFNTETIGDYRPKVNPLEESTDFGRYFGIDLQYFRNRMDEEIFLIFTDFIGEEEIGLTQEDFEEIYYPEE